MDDGSEFLFFNQMMHQSGAYGGGDDFDDDDDSPSPQVPSNYEYPYFGCSKCEKVTDCEEVRNWKRNQKNRM